jgi:hypothetical protein
MLALLAVHHRPAWCAPASAPADNGVIQSAFESAAGLLNEGRPRAALETLRPVEKLEPDNPWLAFYRGLAHLQLGDAYQAMADFDAGLDRLAALGDPEPDLARSIAHYRRLARRQVLSFTYRVGLAYDTNVSYLGSNVATGPGLISGRPDSELVSRFELGYALLATETDTLAFGVRLGHDWYRKVHEFNYQDYGATARYTRRLDEHWELSLGYDYDAILLGNESFLSCHALTPAVEYRWRLRPAPIAPDTTRVYYQYSGLDYLYNTSQPYLRDGPAHAVGAEQTFAFRPLPNAARNGDATIGYRYEVFATDGTEFDHIARYFYLGLGVPVLNPRAPQQYLILPDKELMFRFNATWEVDSYRHPSLFDRYSRNRHDNLRTYGFTISQRLIEHPTYGDLTLLGIVTWTDADSNVSPSDGVYPFTYDKVVYGLQLEWSW